MRNITSLFVLVILSSVPFAASAQTGDVISDLLMALESPIPLATSSKPATTQTTASTQSSATATTSILTVVYTAPLFSIDGSGGATQGNASMIDTLKALVAKLTAQLAALIAEKGAGGDSATTSTTASTTPAVKETGVFVRLLNIGSKGADVTKLQEILIARELFFQKATGYFGAITKEAVRALQAEHEIEPTGTTGRETRDLLNELVDNPRKGLVTYTVPETIELPPMPPISTSTPATSTPALATSTPPIATTTIPAVDTTPPSAPTNAGAGPASNSQMSLAWSAATDNVGVVWYTIQRAQWPIATTSQRVYLDMGLPASTTYQYSIRAVDAAGNVSQPIVTSGTTLP